MTRAQMLTYLAKGKALIQTDRTAPQEILLADHLILENKARLSGWRKNGRRFRREITK